MARKGWLIGAAGLVAVVLVWAVLLQERDPVYDGKRLSEWAKMHRTGPSGNRATEAIQAIGTNAIPWAVKWIDYDTPQWKLKLSKAGGQTPASLLSVLRFLDKLDPPPPPGLEIFEVLGPAAKSAAPELERLAFKQGARETRVKAVMALSWIGPNGLPALGHVLESGEGGVAQMALISVQEQRMRGSDVSPILPSLMFYYHGKRQQFMTGVDWSTITFFQDPSVYQALTNCLVHSNAVVRLEAVRTLDELGTRDAEAYRFVLSDADEVVRNAATNWFENRSVRRRAGSRESEEGPKNQTPSSSEDHRL